LKEDKKEKEFQDKMQKRPDAGQKKYEGKGQKFGHKATEETDPNMRYIVRIVGRDLDGSLPIKRAISGIKGISHRMAGNIAAVYEKVTGKNSSRKLGELSEEEDAELEDIVAHPDKYGIPAWSFNRRKDYETGNDLHLIMNDLEFAKRQDFQRLAEIKSYRGLRHGWGLTVRGQSTRSTHRGKGGVVGVTKKDAAAAAAPKPKAGAPAASPTAAAKPAAKK
jgi:small subunit ribosomal protein S13